MLAGEEAVVREEVEVGVVWEMQVVAQLTSPLSILAMNDARNLSAWVAEVEEKIPIAAAKTGSKITSTGLQAYARNNKMGSISNRANKTREGIIIIIIININRQDASNATVTGAKSTYTSLQTIFAVSSNP